MKEYKLEKTEKYKKSLDAMLHISSMLSNLGYEIVEDNDGYDKFGFYGKYSFGERNIHFRVKAGCCGNVFLEAGCYAENDFDVSMKMMVYDDYECATLRIHEVIKDFVLSKRHGMRDYNNKFICHKWRNKRLNKVAWLNGNIV